eukprot:jgi/Mesen1/3169/ME000184S02241
MSEWSHAGKLRHFSSSGITYAAQSLATADETSEELPLEERESSGNESHIGYNVIGKVEGFLRIPRKKVFAVVQLGSHQFKVTPGDVIYVEKLLHADINEKLALTRVLLLGSASKTIIGRPTIPEASAVAFVEEHALDEKVIIFKKKRRKNYRRTNGHRQELTRLRILDVIGIEEDGELAAGAQGRETAVAV